MAYLGVEYGERMAWQSHQEESALLQLRGLNTAELDKLTAKCCHAAQRVQHHDHDLFNVFDFRKGAAHLVSHEDILG